MEACDEKMIRSFFFFSLSANKLRVNLRKECLRLWFHAFQLEVLRLLVTRFTLHWIGLASNRSKPFCWPFFISKSFLIDWKWPLRKQQKQFFRLPVSKFNVNWNPSCRAFRTKSSRRHRCITHGAGHRSAARKTTSSASTNVSRARRRRISFNSTSKPLGSCAKSI